MAAFYYVAFAFTLLTGVVVGRSGDPAKSYEGDKGFFWIYTSIMLALFLYQLIRGIIFYRRQRKIDEVIPEKAFTTRTASILIVILTISIGACFLILPTVEIVKATAYGGYVFKTHPMSAEPAQFFPLIFFHFVITFLPIISGVLLLAFPPRVTVTIASPSPTVNP